MSFLIADTPTIPCLLRPEMLYDQNNPKGEDPVPGYIFGFIGRSNHAPAFQVMTEHGAIWARVPLHMLCWRDCPLLPLEILCWWDCFSDEFTVHAFDFLGGHACMLIDRNGKQHPGRYVFTVDWRGRWAEIPDQHKQHHFVQLDSGHFAMYPGNRIIWHDSSWIRPLQGPPDWIVNTHSWSVEGRQAPLKATNKVRYE